MSNNSPAVAAPFDPAVLLALAERCEREEPSRELDEAIAVAAFDLEARPYSQRSKRIRTMWWYVRGTDDVMFYGAKGIPFWTASLDAAVTLVPEGWTQNHNQADDGSWWAELREGYRTSYGEVRIAHAKTEAMARCAAALKARAAAAERERESTQRGDSE